MFHHRRYSKRKLSTHFNFLSLENKKQITVPGLSTDSDKAELNLKNGDATFSEREQHKT